MPAILHIELYKTKGCLRIKFDFICIRRKNTFPLTQNVEGSHIYVFILQIIVLILIIDAVIENARRKFLSIVTSESQLTSS